MTESKYKLVKLAKFQDNDYFAIGYFTENKFIFTLIEEGLLKLSPIRSCDIEGLELIGDVHNLPNQIKEIL